MIPAARCSCRAPGPPPAPAEASGTATDGDWLGPERIRLDVVLVQGRGIIAAARPPPSPSWPPQCAPRQGASISEPLSGPDLLLQGDSCLQESSRGSVGRHPQMALGALAVMPQAAAQSARAFAAVARGQTPRRVARTAAPARPLAFAGVSPPALAP
jgi:hypothetical protein